jgi:tellurite resistance protein TerC
VAGNCRRRDGVSAHDVFIIGRRPHEPSMASPAVTLPSSLQRRAVRVGVWVFSGGRYAAEFYAGWLTEYSLSVDNLFIFLIIMSKFAVPRHLQQTALLIGIILALIFRGSSSPSARPRSTASAGSSTCSARS